MKSANVLLVLALLMNPANTLSEAQVDQYGRWINRVSEPWYFESSGYTKEEAAAAQARWRQIQDDVSTISDNEWAGMYRRSSGEVNDAYLGWSPKSGFVSMDVYTCLPDVTSLNYGSTTFSPDLLGLLPEVPIRPSNFHQGHRSSVSLTFETNYLPVKWGDRHYLVPPGHVASFYRYVSGMGEYRYGSLTLARDFFLRVDDDKKSVEGMPILPPGYERFVKKPIDAIITRVGKRIVKICRDSDESTYCESVTPVILNIGRANGLRRSMSLYIVGSKRMETVEVKRVGKYSSRGIIVRSLDDDGKENYKDWDMQEWEPYPEIRVGWQLTTSWHKRDQP